MEYVYTPLESFVIELYRSLGIKGTGHSVMFEVADKLNIELEFYNDGSTATSVAGKWFILLDQSATEEQQWQDFGHELCHVLKHVGKQDELPSSFVLMQEYKARNFAQHFCVPTFMLEKIDFPRYKSQAIEMIAKMFVVEHKFARLRFERYFTQLSSIENYQKLAEETVVYAEPDVPEVVHVDQDVLDANKRPATKEEIVQFFEKHKGTEVFFRSSPSVGDLKELEQLFKLMDISRKGG